MKTAVDCQRSISGGWVTIAEKQMFSLHLTNLDTPSSVLLIELAFHLATAGDWAMFKEFARLLIFE